LRPQSSNGAQEQVGFYDQADDAYKMDLGILIQGGGPWDDLGMRHWAQTGASWDGLLLDSIGTEGYARVIALFLAFPPGDELFLRSFGGSRGYDRERQVILLNGTEFPAITLENFHPSYLFQESDPTEKRIETLIHLGDAVRSAMFGFYAAFLKGELSLEQVSEFNAAYLLAGGSALANSEIDTGNVQGKLEMHLHALNLMSGALHIPVQESVTPAVIGAAPVLDAAGAFSELELTIQAQPPAQVTLQVKPDFGLPEMDS
jgi:hypothetical protein